ncbi:MAG: acetyl-CoA C-acyltransferase, partial [Polyangiaceae bacterium]
IVSDVFIYEALRTPRGKARADGSLASVAPHELVSQLIAALETRSEIDRKIADGLILGCVGQVGAQGGNIAHIVKRAAQLPHRAFAIALNDFCASGLTAIGQAVNAVASRSADCVLAGGVESMSRVPFLGDHADYYTDPTFPEHGQYFPVALAADRLALSERIDRVALDAVALESQTRAKNAETSTTLQKSRIALKTSANAIAEHDECLRETSSESLAALTPAFGALAEGHRKIFGGELLEHVHTIAHAPPMADGAGLALIGNASVSRKPRARVLAHAEIGGDPHASLTAGFAAMDLALKRANKSLAEMDRIEFMEAFAVTIAKFHRDYGVDAAKVNVAGGHLARGHALGATGAILLSSLLDALDDCAGKFGMVVVTGASGVGAAMILERIS